MAEVKPLALVFHLGRAGRVEGDLLQQLRREVHQAPVVGVGLVELEHREFGIVLRRDAFVAEVAVDFVDALEAADDQALEVELGRDAQVEVDVERVVMRDEGARRGAAVERLHHGRLDFDEAAFLELPAQGRDDAGARDENVAHFGIGDQVEIALAVAGLDVLEAVPLLGHA